MERLIIATERAGVELRQLTPADTDAYFDAVDANREHLRQFDDETSAKYPDLAAVQKSIAQPDNPDKLRMGIWDGGNFVGSINLTPDEDDDSMAELGYWLDARHTGKGFATLAARALSSHARMKYDVVVAEVHQGKEASGFVLDRAGFRRIASEAGRLSFVLTNPELEPDPVFAVQLEEAFANPRSVNLSGRPAVSSEDLARRERHYAPQSQLSETVKIKKYEHELQECAVHTQNPEQYLLLLAQAMRRLRLATYQPDLGVFATRRLEKIVAHETAHGKMSAAIGYGSRYGVQVYYDSAEDIWALSPFHSVVGDAGGQILLSRLEEAAIMVAPQVPSTADLFTAQMLGYKDKDEVLEALLLHRPELLEVLSTS